MEKIMMNQRRIARGRRQGSPRDLLRLMAYGKPYKVWLALAMVSLILAGALGLMFPLILRQIIDAVFTPQKDLRMLNQYTLLMIAVFGVQALFSFSRSYLMAYISESILADVRRQVYTHLLTLPLSFFANR